MNLAFIFPGQGSQKLGMGLEFYENFSSAKKLLDDASYTLNIDFKNLMFCKNDNLDISEFTQPAILLNSLMALSAFNESINCQASVLLGHSLGEFSALCAAGAFNYIDALKIVNLRGKLMAKDCEGKGAGMMVILGLSDEKVEQICKNSTKSAWPANYNCDSQIVVAGLKDDLIALENEFKNAGAKRAMLLNMSVASHCKLLQNASDALASELSSKIAQNFKPVISNVNAKAYNKADEAIKLLKAQLVSPVLYKQSINSIENSVDCFIEFGSNVLCGLNKKITQKPSIAINDLASLKTACEFIKNNQKG